MQQPRQKRQVKRNHSNVTSKREKEHRSLNLNESVVVRCNKLLKDSDAATAHALKTNHSSFSECTEGLKPLSMEEKEEMKKKYIETHSAFKKRLLFPSSRIQERIVARRKEQQIADEQKNLEMERKRIVDGKALSDLKQKYIEATMF